jgi:aldose 1-epimerase
MASAPTGNPTIINDPSARTIELGELAAVFLPERGMLGASLRYRGVELLRRLENLDSAAVKGSTAGIPLLYPWANRLESLRYSAGGKRVELTATSSLLHFDDHGLPMHGVPWGQLQWEVTEASKESIAGRLDWNREELLAIFPFRHRVEMTATIATGSLTIETIVSGAGEAVPISFGFHPYFGIPVLGRAGWRLQLPVMRKLKLNSAGIPTGEQSDFGGFDAVLGESGFDDCFETNEERTAFVLSGAGLKITVGFLEGFRYAQIFAPKDKEFVAIEPMTAPTNALTSGRGLTFIAPGGQFRTKFRIDTQAEP